MPKALTWNDRNSDANLSAVLHKLQEDLDIIEELRDDKLASSFALHMRPKAISSLRGDLHDAQIFSPSSLLLSSDWL